MREIPLKKRMRVLKLYFEGYPYDEIADKVGIAKGSVVNIVKELRNGKYPKFASALDIVDELRDLAVRIRKKNISVSQAVIGFRFYERLKFVEPSMLDSYIRMCERISQPDFPIEKFVNSAISLYNLEEKLGKPYGEALKDLEDELERKLSTIEKLKSKVEELEKKREKAERDLRVLKEKYRSKREELAELMDGEESLRKLGVDKVSKLSSFARECEKLEYSVEKLIELLKLVEERDSLREEVEFLKEKINALKKEKKRHSREEFEMIKNNRKLVTASTILKTRRTAILCASCGSPIFVSIPLEGTLYQELRRGAMYSMQCSWCGFTNQISIRDILAAVGYSILIS